MAAAVSPLANAWRPVAASFRIESSVASCPGGWAAGRRGAVDSGGEPAGGRAGGRAGLTADATRFSLGARAMTVGASAAAIAEPHAEQKCAPRRRGLPQLGHVPPAGGFIVGAA